MELINLSRILPTKIKVAIEDFCKDYAGDEPYSLSLGQIYIGAKPMLDDMVIEVIMDTVCKHYRVNKVLVRSKTRTQPYMKIRQVVMWFAKKYTNYILLDVGKKIGDFNHATVLHSVKVINGYIANEPGFSYEINKIDAALQEYFLNKAKEKTPEL